jgi:hypothetical protein
LLLFFSNYSIPLSRLIISNPHGLFKLEERNIIFESPGYRDGRRSLILKEGGTLEVFILC